MRPWAHGPLILRDPELDHLLEHRGYAVTRFLPADEARSLRNTYGDIHGWARKEHSEHQPPDFELTFHHQDLSHRAQVVQTVESAVSSALERRLVGHEPIAWSFLVKWPSDGSSDDKASQTSPGAFHRDAGFVDERRGSRSFMVWIALEDIGPWNGGLEVVEYSHLVDRGLRCLNGIPPWLEHGALFEERAVSLELTAGEAVIFDPALIHRSRRNGTSSPRVAATILVKRPGDELALYRPCGEGRAERVPLHPTVFIDTRADELQHLPASAVVPYRPKSLGQRQVERRLDSQVYRRVSTMMRRLATRT